MQKKRNPRLLSDFADKPPSTEPPSGSLFQKLVDNPESVAISNMCYNTDYIQGIREGTLDANIYGNFNVSDAYYCYAGAKDYEEAAKRAHDEPELMGYLAEKARSYQKYNDSFKDTWRLTGGRVHTSYPSDQGVFRLGDKHREERRPYLHADRDAAVQLPLGLARRKAQRRTRERQEYLRLLDQRESWLRRFLSHR